MNDTINNTQNPYFILETAFHHEGNIEFLESLIESFKDINANAIKFHLLFDLNDYMVANHPALEVLRKISIPQDKWQEILEKTVNSGKEIILLCNDIESMKWVNSIQDKFPISAIEIHSTGLNDIFLLNEALNFKKTIIIGVGGSTFDEVQYAVNFLKDNNKTDILLMHGFQNYPTNYSDINLKRMLLLKEAFGLPLGYADHTDPTDTRNEIISVLPIVSGFNIIEKHVTNVPGEKRTDAQAAVSVEQMKGIISLAQDISKVNGVNNYELSDAEKKYGNTGPMKKAMVARLPIKKGEKITLDKIAFKRTEVSSPLLQKDLHKVIDNIAKEDIAQDEILSFGNISYEFKKDDFGQFFIKK
ncbi:N-acetylneuraminate synthase family protein [Chryseobacterium sp.]|mgnify:CR=1 FL=1|uniref:N-acetylneuraminate synthase family protein n=1 Tax=Chryseobacterium sp. TaxID=1871047 RepID=UPI0025C28A5B|nr:N-acetylneuraminate synthase family protein [Chryseobacterium sp.]